MVAACLNQDGHQPSQLMTAQLVVLHTNLLEGMKCGEHHVGGVEGVHEVGGEGVALLPDIRSGCGLSEMEALDGRILQVH